MFNRKNRFLVFIKKQGFYIALIACIVAIGGISYFAVASNESSKVEKSGDTSLSEEMHSKSSSTPSPVATPLPTPSPTPAKTAAPTAAPQKKQTWAAVWHMPVKGVVIAGFDSEKFVFNKTLSQWTTHNGVDIRANEGDDVVAVLAGIVEDVYSDDLCGKTVAISHTGGKKTYYCGMKETTVEKGAKVNAGQKLGTVGTPPFEASEGAHLHFEYVVNGVHKAPEFGS